MVMGELFRVLPEAAVAATPRLGYVCVPVLAVVLRLTDTRVPL